MRPTKIRNQPQSFIITRIKCNSTLQILMSLFKIIHLQQSLCSIHIITRISLIIKHRSRKLNISPRIILQIKLPNPKSIMNNRQSRINIINRSSQLQSMMIISHRSLIRTFHSITLTSINKNSRIIRNIINSFIKRCNRFFILFFFK